MPASDKINIVHISEEFGVDELNAVSWDRSVDVMVRSYWSGKAAPAGRHFSARLMWSDTAIYVRFEANQSEPLIVSDTPKLEGKTHGLWDRDVCEIFIAPDRGDPNRYFEFEVAPTGEWIDIGIEMSPTDRISDWDYSSGMESAARIEDGRIVSAMKIPWTAFGKAPKAGDVWLGNLFRCVGKDPTRGYLSWQATFTEHPAFHVPARFGEFEFVE